MGRVTGTDEVVPLDMSLLILQGWGVGVGDASVAWRRGNDPGGAVVVWVLLLVCESVVAAALGWGGSHTSPLFVCL